jgi:hypothetical protein
MLLLGEEIITSKWMNFDSKLPEEKSPTQCCNWRVSMEVTLKWRSLSGVTSHHLLNTLYVLS